MKYIGPFLRTNSLSVNNIKNQLYFLSKESLKHIVLHSKCGIPASIKDLKLKNVPTNDINTFKSISPLLCIYKKASCKLVSNNGELTWNEDKFKKEVQVSGNVFMILSLMELVSYYRKFENIDNKNYYLANIYYSLTGKQLEFMASYLRNADGVFVDKKDLSNPITGELKFEEKNKNFDFSTQALFMAAYYKHFLLDEKNGANCKTFALDILNMFINFKSELYECSLNELIKICFGINIFYRYSGSSEAEALLLDLSDLIIDRYNEADSENRISDDNITSHCIALINFLLMYKDTGMDKLKEICDKLHSKFIDMYNPELGIFMKQSDRKEMQFASDEILAYILALMEYSRTIGHASDDNAIILDIYKHHIINSGIIPSWPEIPDLDSAERYRNFSLNHEDLLDDQDFKMASIPSPENSELAPVFIKSVTYNRKKDTFVQPKQNFDSTKNMMIFFLVLYLNR